MKLGKLRRDSAYQSRVNRMFMDEKSFLLLLLCKPANNLTIVFSTEEQLLLPPMISSGGRFLLKKRGKFVITGQGTKECAPRKGRLRRRSDGRPCPVLLSE